MKDKDREEDNEIGLSEGFMDFDISESTIMGFVDWMFPEWNKVQDDRRELLSAEPSTLGTYDQNDTSDIGPFLPEQKVLHIPTHMGMIFN